MAALTQVFELPYPPSVNPYWRRVGFRTLIRRGGRRYRRDVVVEHQGFPRRKAETWWRTRSNEPFPDTADEAVDPAQAGALASTVAITVERRTGEPFDRVVAYRLEEKPPRLDSEEGLPECTAAFDADEVPF